MGTKQLLFATLLCLACTSYVTDAQNEPHGMACDITELVRWFSSITDAAKWNEIFITRNFTQFCREIDVLIRNTAGCIELTTLFSPELKEDTIKIYNILAIMQFYCGVAIPTQVCDEQAMIGCGVAVTLTTQEMIRGDISDARDICLTYDGLVTSMNECVNTAVSGCDELTRSSLLAKHNSWFKYLTLANDYCGAGCGEIIVFLANQKENCSYIMDFSSLDYRNYCTYIHNSVNCIYDLHQRCLIGPPTVATLGVDSILLYSDAIGCNINIGGLTVEDVIDYTALPQCAAASIKCVRDLAGFFGLKTTLGPYGGYNWVGLRNSMDELADKLLSGDIYQICDFIVNDTWTTIYDCSIKLIDGCPLGVAASKTRDIIENRVDEIIRGGCAAGCIQMAEDLKKVKECTSVLKLNNTDAKYITGQIFLGLIQQGGANIEVCKLARLYVECTIGVLKRCQALYDNYIIIVSQYSDINMIISLCNIKINLRLGEIYTKENGDETLLLLGKVSSSTTLATSIHLTIGSALASFIVGYWLLHNDPK